MPLLQADTGFFTFLVTGSEEAEEGVTPDYPPCTPAAPGSTSIGDMFGSPSTWRYILKGLVLLFDPGYYLSFHGYSSSRNHLLELYVLMICFSISSSHILRTGGDLFLEKDLRGG